MLNIPLALLPIIQVYVAILAPIPPTGILDNSRPNGINIPTNKDKHIILIQIFLLYFRQYTQYIDKNTIDARWNDDAIKIVTQNRHSDLRSIYRKENKQNAAATPALIWIISRNANVCTKYNKVATKKYFVYFL